MRGVIVRVGKYGESSKMFSRPMIEKWLEAVDSKLPENLQGYIAKTSITLRSHEALQAIMKPANLNLVMEWKTAVQYLVRKSEVNRDESLRIGSVWPWLVFEQDEATKKVMGSFGRLTDAMEELVKEEGQSGMTVGKKHCSRKRCSPSTGRISASGRGG